MLFDIDAQVIPEPATACLAALVAALYRFNDIGSASVALRRRSAALGAGDS